jgi:hypothetical protein
VVGAKFARTLSCAWLGSQFQFIASNYVVAEANAVTKRGPREEETGRPGEKKTRRPGEGETRREEHCLLVSLSPCLLVSVSVLATAGGFKKVRFLVMNV